MMCLNPVQLKDKCGIYGDHDDSDIVIVQTWQKVWRDGIAPQLSTPALVALQKALATDDKRLLQGATTSPPPLQCVQDWPVEGACSLGYCGWQGEGLETVAEVEEFFAHVCYEADQKLGEPAACRWFLNWFDETPREEMRRQLAAEIAHVLAQRQPAVAEGRSPL
jgi:hypothetical protein